MSCCHLLLLALEELHSEEFKGSLPRVEKKIPQPVMKSEKKDKSQNSRYCPPGCVGPNASPLGLRSSFASWSSTEGPRIESAWG